MTRTAAAYHLVEQKQNAIVQFDRKYETSRNTSFLAFSFSSSASTLKALAFPPSVSPVIWFVHQVGFFPHFEMTKTVRKGQSAVVCRKRESGDGDDVIEGISYGLEKGFRGQ